MSNLRQRDVVALVIAALLLLAAATSGADFIRYEDWGLAGLSGDLSEARVYTISPLGVPLMMWAHGTGFVFAAADALLLGVPVFRTSAALIGWCAALVLWAAMLRVFWIVSRGNRVLTLFAAAVFFLATHGGYFSHVHASESLSLACVAVLVWLVFDESDDHLLVALIAGLAVALLVVIKSHLAVYGAGTLVILGMRARRAGLGVRRSAAVAAAVCVPVAIAVAQVALANRWMTGSPLTSSYQFGDEAFRSFDFADPELVAVLIHPWHGLLSYHPFYAIGFAALLLMAWRAPQREQRLFFLFGGLAVLVNLYLQAAWVVWWLGKGSLGMRGAASASAIVMPAFVMLLAGSWARRSWWVSALTIAAIACSSWSGLLLVRGTEPQYHTYEQMRLGQAEALATVTGLPFVLFAAVSFVALLLLYGREIRRGSQASDLARGSSGDSGAMRRAVLVASLALVSFAFAYLAREGVYVMRDRPSATILIGSIAALVITAAYSSSRRRFVGKLPEPPALAAGAALVVFGLGSLLFFRLAVNIESDIAAGRRPERRYAYVNTFSTRDMRDSCNEYRRAWGFDDKRDAFKAFLIRSGVDPADFRF